MADRMWQKTLTIIYLCITTFVYAQTKEYSDFRLLLNLENNFEYDSITKLNDKVFILKNPSKEGKILEIFAGAYNATNRYDLAYNYFKKAKDFYLKNDEPENVANINAELWGLVNSRKFFENERHYYLDEIKRYADSSGSKKWLMSYYGLKAVETFSPKTKDSSQFYFKNALSLAKELDSISPEIQYNINLGVLELEQYKNSEAALNYYNKALLLTDKLSDDTDKNEKLFAIYNNIGQALRRQGDYRDAINYYKKAEDIELLRFDRKSKRILYANIDQTYYTLGNYKLAYDYFAKYDSLNQIIKDRNQNVKIEEVEEKFQNEKLRADNLEIEVKRKQNRNIAFGLGGSLLLFSIIGFLFYNNRKRKQELIMKEQLLRQEQLKSQLKEEELKSVDAMIEGQEKERLNIANELHDELGSLMATIKMHFSSLNIDSGNEIFTKTNALLDNAYHKIRNISHAKNAGVLAEKGLFKAVNDLAKNISISNQINIKVYGNTNQQRLSNSLEINLFRIIQELITNAIKHAKASLLEIHLTIDENNLNILVEDNGIGFLPEQRLKNKSGIGLNSIENRIENLGGSFFVESQLNRGTSVIIDVPIN